MAGRIVRGGCKPRHMHRTGRGWREDAATGFVRYADDYVQDVRQGFTAKEFADITPGFGTYHPQDLRALGDLDDPSAIDNAAPISTPKSKQDLNISDQEVLLSIREGRPPRNGY